ncbi:hypothetical protein SAMN02745135_01682 [Caloranaerobacter azorensis DSM 13643]|uniref:Uncharacterized protein n=1 Tax=Caloranaerobacter azorensis DSM 13643 TaxID=1121264 RepID=A0A1M5V0U6_9FIRM|nr:hypothetical protein [Caloranaerobacter azorensis]SHH68875.1 hypothetical protein SAMN02745135_01682 [Caloranaerobacter azorensis DSM 13643]
MYNYQVILGKESKTLFFITNANKSTTKKLISSFYFLKIFQLYQKNMINFFNENGYELVLLPTKDLKLSDIIINLDYEVIDLTNIDNEIRNAFKSIQ